MKRPTTLLITGALAAAGALGAGAVALAAAGAGTSSKPSAAAAVSELAFVRGNDLYTIRSDGTGLRRLTATRVPEGAPRWSPDGTRLAFSRSHTGRAGPNDEIYVADADGRNARRLTNNSRQDLQPVWSPDGRHLAFVSDRGRPGEPEIWIMRSDGSQPRRLVRTVNHRGWQDSQYNPAWSPDGRRIFFSLAVAEGNPEIFSVGLDGKGLRRLTRTLGDAHRLGDDTMPHVSPDGRTVVFVSNRNRVSSDLWVMRADGSSERKLTGVAGSDEWFPRYSPDGASLAYTSIGVLDNRSSIVVARADGSGARRLTSGGEADWRPAG